MTMDLGARVEHIKDVLHVERKLDAESAEARANFVKRYPACKGMAWADALDLLDDLEAYNAVIEDVTSKFENRYGIPDGRHFLPLVILTLLYANDREPTIEEVRAALDRVV